MNLLKHRFVSGKGDGPDATQVQPSNWNDGHTFVGGASGNVLVRDPSDANFGATWSPWGAWVDAPYDASAFVGGGSMIWTVPAGAVITYGHALLGKLLTVAFYLDGTSISGTPDPLLIVRIPGGYYSARNVIAPAVCYDANVTPVPTRLYLISGDPGIRIQQISGDPWQVSSGTTYIFGLLTFPIV